ncbi:MAG: response regulator transcription factor [Planctomycetota bacterium]|jgi:DNA-binding response OmpR family regulator
MVLVVEDDPAIRRGLVDALSYRGFRVREAEDGRTGLETALGAELDLVLLDVLLPEMDGFSVLEELRRAKPRLPVIMVTARGMESDTVRGLSAGADDYVVKPFSAKELLARVDAVLRRSAERPATVSVLERAGRTIHLERREVTLPDGATRILSEKEADLLIYLASAPGRAVAREELLQHVWGIDPRGVSTRTVDMHVARLREKLDDAAGEPQVLVTVRGKGYMLAGEDAS